MSQLQPFFFDGREVRVVRDEQGEPWFVAKDVCDVLGLGNPTEALRRLDDDERGTLRITEGTSPSGGNPNVNTVSESGLYALIFTSRKPEARAFRKWVTGTVLPAIRKTGRFEAPRGGRLTMSPAAGRMRQSSRVTVLSCAVRLASLENGGFEQVRHYFDRFCELVGGQPPQQGTGRVHYLDFEDLFWQWADACVERVEGGEVQAKNLYASFRDWCRQSRNMEPPTMHVFGTWLGNNFHRRISNVVYYKGLRLRADGRQAA